MKSTLKKIVCVTLILTMLGLMFGCTSGNASSSSEDVMAAIMRKGKVTAAISLGNEPWCWRDTDGQIKGVAIDLIEGFAKSIDVEVEYVILEFSGLIPAIQAEKADIICTNLTRKPSRATSILYTEGVGSTYGVVIVRKGEFNAIEDLNNANVTLTTEVGSIYEEVGTSTFPNAKMSPTENNSDALAAVKAGRADAMVTDLGIATAACAQDDTIEYLTPYIFTDTFGFAAKCSVSAVTFVECFNIYLRVIKSDGTYASIFEKYFDKQWVPTFMDAAI
ncbi:MAG: ABC transporter substrate-binding protein [Clostridiaceae bacterium]|nr:ABC transporter substrate-binding protein [Eubacteriales bacterium]